MIRGQTTKLKDKFRCLSPDCSAPFVSRCRLWFPVRVLYITNGTVLEASTIPYTAIV